MQQVSSVQTSWESTQDPLFYGQEISETRQHVSPLAGPPSRYDKKYQLHRAMTTKSRQRSRQHGT